MQPTETTVGATPSTPRKRVRLRFIVFAVVFVGVAAFIMWPRPGRSVVIQFTYDKAGDAQLYGVSLSNTNVRDAVFTLIRKSGVRTSVTIKESDTNQRSNFWPTLEAMARAGIVATGAPPAAIVSPAIQRQIGLAK